jgi:transcriptional regulator with XRE-family HTH domain
MVGPIESASPALCRLHLSTELRRLREEKGLTAGEVARRFHWAPSKMTRLEKGDDGVIKPSDVMLLCQIYDADPETAARLESYAVVTKTKKDWWQSPEYRPVIPPGFSAYLGLEETAAQIHNYESEFVPGLLQTEDYIRATHRRAVVGLAADEIDRMVAIRTTRSEVLRRSDNAPKLTAILNEAVLRRQVGGTETMAGQLAHMVELAESLPHLKILVVPFAAGAHPGMNGQFIILRFRHPGHAPIVYLENLAGAGVTRRPDDVERYEDTFSDLLTTALDREQSLRLIKNAHKEF